MFDHDTYRVLASRTMLHLHEWPGGSPSVFFLHSITANGLLAMRLGRLLSPRWRVIAPDLRGRGQSDVPFGDYSPATHVKELTTVLNQMHLDRIVLAGHSFGAMLSVLIAAQQPERIERLILFDGGAQPDPNAAAMLSLYYDTLQYRYASIDDYVNRFRQSPLYQPWTEELDALVRSNLIRQPDGTYMRSVARYVLEAERKPENLAVWTELEALYPLVRCPVLIVRAEYGITGREDRVLSDATLATMVAGMPQAQVVDVPDTGHTSLMTIPSEIRDQAILSFLSAK